MRGLILQKYFEDSIDRFDFIVFMKKLISKTGTNVTIVMDKAGFHTANDCKDYFRKRKLYVIFIIPRVPMLNDWTVLQPFEEPVQEAQIQLTTEEQKGRCQEIDQKINKRSENKCDLIDLPARNKIMVRTKTLASSDR